MPSITSTPACLVRPSYRRRASAASAITPPSPSLSARISTITYLTDTISVTDQKISETTPYTSPSVGRTAPSSIENTVCNAYKGLVPMSPNTMPSAASTRPEAGRPCPASVVGSLSARGVAPDAVEPLTNAPSFANRTRPATYRLPHPYRSTLALAAVGAYPSLGAPSTCPVTDPHTAMQGQTTDEAPAKGHAQN